MPTPVHGWVSVAVHGVTAVAVDPSSTGMTTTSDPDSWLARAAKARADAATAQGLVKSCLERLATSYELLARVGGPRPRPDRPVTESVPRRRSGASPR